MHIFSFWYQQKVRMVKLLNEIPRQVVANGDPRELRKTCALSSPEKARNTSESRSTTLLRRPRPVFELSPNLLHTPFLSFPEKCRYHHNSGVQ
jgi:hypothetical protein